MAELPPRLPSNQSRSCSIASQRVSHADEREPPRKQFRIVFGTTIRSDRAEPNRTEGTHGCQYTEKSQQLLVFNIPNNSEFSAARPSRKCRCGLYDATI